MPYKVRVEAQIAFEALVPSEVVEMFGDYSEAIDDWFYSEANRLALQAMLNSDSDLDVLYWDFVEIEEN